jgi:hypothetical protein
VSVGGVSHSGSSTSGTSSTGTVDQDWPRNQYDRGNSGYHPNATGPTDNVVKQWRLDTGAPIDGGAVLVECPDGTVRLFDKEEVVA